MFGHARLGAEQEEDLRQMAGLTTALRCVATGLGSDAGIEDLGQVLSFLQRTQPGVAGRIKDSMKEHIS